MTKEEFAMKIAELNLRIEAAKKEGAALFDKYIEENAPYKIGDKVKIVEPAKNGKPEYVKYGFIASLGCTEDGMFTPEIHDIKKDGTEHKAKKVWVSWWKNPTVEVIND